MTLKIAIIEDEKPWQDGIKALLKLLPSHQLVGVFSNAIEAKSGLSIAKADVYLMDWKLGEGEDGLTVAAYLCKSQGVKPWQIIMTTGSPQEQIPEGLEYGYVSKASIARDLVGVINKVAERLNKSQF